MALHLSAEKSAPVVSPAPIPRPKLTLRGIHHNLKPDQRRNFPRAINRVLQRWEDLSGVVDVTTIDAETFHTFREKARLSGFYRSTIEKTIRVVMKLLRFAQQDGLVDDIPDDEEIRYRRPLSGPPPTRQVIPPISPEELERVLSAARTMTDDIHGIPASLWWPAFILLVADTGLYAADVLRLKLRCGRDSGTHMNGESGTLKLGKQEYRLHPHTAQALEALREYKRVRLFPWTKDKAEPFHMLYHEYRRILLRAGLPTAQSKPLIALRNVKTTAPGTLDSINPDRQFPANYSSPPRPKNASRKMVPAYGSDGIYRVRNDSEETLRHFFETVYAPLRLAGGSRRTLEAYRSIIGRYSDYLGCDATFGHLTEDHLDNYRTWCVDRVGAHTINRSLRHLLALWRYAWRKRKVDELPRDVEFLPTMKTNPEAWSQEELARLLNSAAETPGEVKGIPGRLWWPALILTLYDTGLRIGAALSIRSEDLDLQGGIVHCRADDQKQKAAQIFQLHVDTLKALREINPAGRELVFNFPWAGGQRSIYKRLDDILERAGLPINSRSKFHRVRRTTATVLCEQTGSEEIAMRHLGHSHISVTRRYLDQTKITPKINSADVLPRPKWEGGQS